MNRSAKSTLPVPIVYFTSWSLPPQEKKKLWVVFDSGAGYQGRSIDSERLQGPDLTNSLIGVLLRFGLEPIELMADVKSMFHQVRVSKQDIDFLCFLWWPEGHIKQDPGDHHMLVHIFGAVLSPSCANFALRWTAEDNPHCRQQVTDTIIKKIVCGWLSHICAHSSGSCAADIRPCWTV